MGGVRLIGDGISIEARLVVESRLKYFLDDCAISCSIVDSSPSGLPFRTSRVPVYHTSPGVCRSRQLLMLLEITLRHLIL